MEKFNKRELEKLCTLLQPYMTRIAYSSEALKLLLEIDLDEYHEAISIYRDLQEGKIAILIIGNHKYIKMEEPPCGTGM